MVGPDVMAGRDKLLAILTMPTASLGAAKVSTSLAQGHESVWRLVPGQGHQRSVFLSSVTASVRHPVRSSGQDAGATPSIILFAFVVANEATPALEALTASVWPIAAGVALR